MTSLAFRVLDRHVVGGRADEMAIEDQRGTMSYAQLLHESASVAGALTQVDVVAGTAVVIDLPAGREQVVAVLACARIGAVPADSGAYRFGGTPPMLQIEEAELAWEVLVRAGRVEPASAPENDPEGYEQLMRERYEDVFAALTAGATIPLVP